MFVVTVEFDLDDRFVARFMAAIVENARESRSREQGCRQFDVCVSQDDPAAVFLYEVYDDSAAFDAHRMTAHFKRFDSAVKDWVRAKRVKLYVRQSNG